MILVDNRTGSKDLAGYLRHWGVSCEVTRLDYGDAAFPGNGPQGPLYIGIEIKAITDALSCMTDGRFSGHQLPGLVRTYDRTWLVLEGHIYPRYSDGILQVGTPGKRKPVGFGRRCFMYRDLDNWITSMENCAGLRVRRTVDRVETARFIADSYGWWSKEWSEHKSHLAFDESGPDAALLVRPSLLRRIAAQLPGVGFGKSGAVASKFRDVEHMVQAGVGEWQEIDGIGEVLAKKCWGALRGK